MLKLFHYLHKFIKYVYYSHRLGSYGIHSFIDRPLKIDGPESIYIGNKVYVGYKTWLASIPLTGSKESNLIVEDGCIIGHFNHIYATKRVVLHKNVLTADKVYISDNLHGYEDTSIPILRQPIVQKREVEIGEGSWLGENVCVIGANIGRNCVIGANSVVTKDIPDFCVAVGSPARIIKQYNIYENSWQRINDDRLSQISLDGGGDFYYCLCAA